MKKLAIWIFCILYLLVSFVSTIHIISFFELSNSHWLAVTLGIAFELGSAASLLAIAALERSNKYIIWGLFIIMTMFQIQANMFSTYSNLHDYKTWIDLFGLTDADEMTQKRVLSWVAGAILPIVALGFIKSLVDYMKNDDTKADVALEEIPTENEPYIKDPIPEPGFREAETEVKQPEVQEQKSSVDDQILRSRELASQLVSDFETDAPAQIDNQAATDVNSMSSDARLARGMQVKL